MTEESREGENGQADFWKILPSTRRPIQTLPAAPALPQRHPVTPSTIVHKTQERFRFIKQIGVEHTAKVMGSLSDSAGKPKLALMSRVAVYINTNSF